MASLLLTPSGKPCQLPRACVHAKFFQSCPTLQTGPFPTLHSSSKYFYIFTHFLLLSFPVQRRALCSPRLTAIPVTLILSTSASSSTHNCQMTFFFPSSSPHSPSPSAYKQAKISLPIPREHSLDIISPKLLSFLFSSLHCQLLERNRLTDSHFLTTHSYLMPLQSGFQPSGSNNSALTQITKESTGC